jgi:hypothetical protein
MLRDIVGLEIINALDMRALYRNRPNIANANHIAMKAAPTIDIIIANIMFQAKALFACATTASSFPPSQATKGTSPNVKGPRM